MKKLLVLFCVAALVAQGAGTALALTDTATHDITITVDEVAMLALDDNSALSFTVSAPAVAGDPFVVTEPGDVTKYLQFTSIVTATTTRKITAQLGTALPAGIFINVAATDAAGGCGTLGTAVASTALSTTDADVVAGIGSGYTGSAADSDGVQLVYSISAINCGDAGTVFENPGTTVTVTYTLTEDA